MYMYRNPIAGRRELLGRDTVTLTAEPLTIGALGASVVCPTAGGIASFIGTTRDSFNGKRVLRLEV
jgi:molybdopterin synthase catalytic subunit|tara:strand:+ start:368 stop:565 length:198 start_codon:yes stop_codon:yes gene_type:complete